MKFKLNPLNKPATKVLKQCSPQALAAGVFAGYSCVKRRLLPSDKSKEKLCFSFCNIISHVEFGSTCQVPKTVSVHVISEGNDKQ